MIKPKLEDYQTPGNMINPHGSYDYEKYSKAMELYVEYIERFSQNKTHFMFISNVKKQSGEIIYKKGSIAEGVLQEDNTVLFYNPKYSSSLNATRIDIIELNELINMGKLSEKFLTNEKR